MTPLEQLFGISHGEQFVTSGRGYLVLDNVDLVASPGSLRQFHSSAPELLHINGYGVKRFLALGIVCWVMTYFTLIKCVDFPLTLRIPKKEDLEKYGIFFLLPLGAALEAYIPLDLILSLFVMSSFLLITQASRQSLNGPRIVLQIKVIEGIRLIWTGHLLVSLYGLRGRIASSVASDNVQLTFALVGFILSTCLALKEKRSHPSHWSNTRMANRAPLERAFRVGMAESLTVFTLWYLVLLWDWNILFKLTEALGLYCWGRLVMSLLLRQVLAQNLEKKSDRPAFSFERIAAATWLLSPLPFVALLFSHTWQFLLVWTFVSSILVMHGRPWGSPADNTKSTREILNRIQREPTRKKLPLTLTQKAALFIISQKPEFGALILDSVTPENRHSLACSINTLPTVTPEFRTAALAEVAAKSGNSLRGNWQPRLDDWVESNLPSIIATIQCDYLKTQIDLSYYDKNHANRKGRTDLGQWNPSCVQKAAILFMTLPPEQSAILFSELTPNQVQAVTMEITQLPTIFPPIRRKTLMEFISLFPGKRRKKKHVCLQCGTALPHGIGLRKHQRQTGHKGSRIFTGEWLYS